MGDTRLSSGSTEPDVWAPIISRLNHGDSGHGSQTAPWRFGYVLRFMSSMVRHVPCSHSQASRDFSARATQTPQRRPQGRTSHDDGNKAGPLSRLLPADVVSVRLEGSSGCSMLAPTCAAVEMGEPGPTCGQEAWRLARSGQRALSREEVPQAAPSLSWGHRQQGDRKHAPLSGQGPLAAVAWRGR